jgi:ABC transporter substrate binding protein
LAARYRLPAIYIQRAFVAASGLISYGVDVTDLFRRAAPYVDRILKGAKPADLPVQQPTKFELAINLKPPKRSASTCRPRCSRLQTRSSNSCLLLHLLRSGSGTKCECGHVRYSAALGGLAEVTRTLRDRRD